MNAFDSRDSDSPSTGSRSRSDRVAGGAVKVVTPQKVSNDTSLSSSMSPQPMALEDRIDRSPATLFQFLEEAGVKVSPSNPMSRGPAGSSEVAILSSSATKP